MATQTNGKANQGLAEFETALRLLQTENAKAVQNGAGGDDGGGRDRSHPILPDRRFPRAPEGGGAAWKAGLALAFDCLLFATFLGAFLSKYAPDGGKSFCDIGFGVMCWNDLGLAHVVFGVLALISVALPVAGAFMWFRHNLWETIGKLGEREQLVVGGFALAVGFVAILDFDAWKSVIQLMPTHCTEWNESGCITGLKLHGSAAAMVVAQLGAAVGTGFLYHKAFPKG